MAFEQQCNKQYKFKVGFSGHAITIKPEMKVLDIGSGHNPNPRANVLIDLDTGESIHRSGEPAIIDRNDAFILADACSMPFKDKSFDFILSLHVAEHMDNPEIFCKEVMRVGKAGYIETPSKLCEIILGEPFHLYFVSKKGSVLNFERKKGKTRRVIWFYHIFYYGQRRADFSSKTASNKIMHLFNKVLNYLVIRYWYLWPIRRFMYTCFEWNNSFIYKVKY